MYILELLHFHTVHCGKNYGIFRGCSRVEVTVPVTNYSGIDNKKNMRFGYLCLNYELWVTFTLLHLRENRRIVDTVDGLFSYFCVQFV
jgi:hypothetical protein